MSTEEGSKSDATSGISEVATFTYTSSKQADSYPLEARDPSSSEENTNLPKSSIPDNSVHLNDDSPKEDPEPLDNLSVAASFQQTSNERAGEWGLLITKLIGLLEDNQLPTQLNLLLKPGLLLLGLIGLTVLLRVYGNILNAIDQVPSASRLFEFVGLLWLLRFYATKIVRSEDRQEFFSTLSNQWEIFLGGPKKEN